MTATILLVRHAAHDGLGGHLADPEVQLGADGRAQAERLARCLAAEGPAAIHTSPRPRARETAAAIAAVTGRTPEVVEDLDEIRFGSAWTGRTFDDLDRDERWRRWNAARTLTATPGGETILAVQHRMVGHLDACRAAFDGLTLIVVSHCDPIRTVVAFHLGLSLDALTRFDIAPASTTRLEIDAWEARILFVNQTVS